MVERVFSQIAYVPAYVPDKPYRHAQAASCHYSASLWLFFVAQAAGLDVEGKEYTSLVADFYHEMGGPEAAGCFGQGEAHRSVQQRPEGPLRERRRR